MSLIEQAIDTTTTTAIKPAAEPEKPGRLATHEYIRTFSLLAKAIGDVGDQFQKLPQLGAQRAVDEALTRIVDLLPAIKKYADKLRGAN